MARETLLFESVGPNLLKPGAHFADWLHDQVRKVLSHDSRASSDLFHSGGVDQRLCSTWTLSEG